MATSTDILGPFDHYPASRISKLHPLRGEVKDKGH